MTRPYSNDLRERALARVERGETIRAVAAAFDISASCLSKWGALKHRTGDVAPGKIGGHKKRTLSGEIAEGLGGRMRGSAFTLRGLVVELAERGVKAKSARGLGFRPCRGAELQKNSGGLGADASRRRAQTNAVEGSPSQRRS